MPAKLFGYDVVEQIGRGAASLLYAISDPATHQLYALKHVVRHSERDVRYIAQLENEWIVGRQLNHEGLRKSIDLKTHRTFLRRITEAALIMELFDGAPLDKIPARGIPETLDLFIQVARALDALHHQGFIHCDMKPANILISPLGRVKVIDFGQACPSGTIKHRIQGTPDFIAPEQVDLKPVAVKTDVFNFGATLYWTLTRKKVPTLITVRKSSRHFLSDEQFAPPRSLDQNIPQSLSDMVMECIRMEPARRLRDMNVVAAQLEQIIKELQPKNPAARRSENCGATAVAPGGSPAIAQRSAKSSTPRAGIATSFEHQLDEQPRK